jgi:hypothetical protein
MSAEGGEIVKPRFSTEPVATEYRSGNNERRDKQVVWRHDEKLRDLFLSLVMSY